MMNLEKNSLDLFRLQCKYNDLEEECRELRLANIKLIEETHLKQLEADTLRHNIHELYRKVNGGLNELDSGYSHKRADDQSAFVHNRKDNPELET